MEGTEEIVTPRSQRWIVLVAILAFVAVVAGAVVIMQSGEDDELQPLSFSSGGSQEADFADAAMSAMPFQEIRYELGGELPDLGSAAPVYRLSAPEMDGDRVQEMAAALGVEGLLEASDQGWTISDDDAVFQVGPTAGGWWVSYGSGMVQSDSVAVPGVAGGSTATTVPDVADGEAVTVAEPEGPENLPSQEEAEAIARDLLESLGVLDGEWSVATSPSGMMGVAVACAEGEECPESDVQETILSWSVTFARVVDGVEASGLEWAVEVGDAGEVQNVWGTLTELESMGEYPLRSTTEVFEDLKAGEGVFPGPVPLGAEVPAVQAPAVDSGDAGAVDEPSVGAGQSSAGAGATEPGAADPGAGEPPVTHTVPCPEDARCPDGVLVEPVPGPDLPEGPGDPVAPGEPTPATVPSVTTVPSVPEPEPVVVTITDAERSAMLYPGTEDGVAVTYLVPTYRYLGSYADGSEFQSYDLLALDEAYVEVPEPTVTTSVLPPSSTGPSMTTVPPDPDSSTSTYPVSTLVPPSPQPPFTSTSRP